MRERRARPATSYRGALIRWLRGEGRHAWWGGASWADRILSEVAIVRTAQKKEKVHRNGGQAGWVAASD